MGRDLARLAVLGTGLMVASCAAGGAAAPLALYPSSPEGHQARLRGRLAMEGGCLYIVGEGGERWLAAFPSPGTRWVPDENAVQVGKRTVRVGETGAFAGGEASGAPGTVAWVRAPAAGCDAAKVWMVTTLMDP